MPRKNKKKNNKKGEAMTPKKPNVALKPRDCIDEGEPTGKTPSNETHNDPESNMHKMLPKEKIPGSFETLDDGQPGTSKKCNETNADKFLRVLRLHEKIRQECTTTQQECVRIQRELDASLQNMADLETKLFHARRLLEMESKARRETEHDRDQLNERLQDETRDKLAFLNTLPRKRKSMGRRNADKCNEINSTGSFLSDLSITQSEDDFLDANASRTSWKPHRPSQPVNAVTKRARLSNGGGHLMSRSGAHRTSIITGTGSMPGIQSHTLEVAPGAERICATTKVTIPQDAHGAIRAESTIESGPPIQQTNNTNNHNNNNNNNKNLNQSPFKEATAPQVSPLKATTTTTNPFMNIGSPALLHTKTMREHNFASKTIIRTENCNHCNKKIRLGTVCLRCRDCSLRCHMDCKPLLLTTCVPQSSTPTASFKGMISDYVPNVAPMIPALIVHCVNEIETRGLGEIGIYRVSGSEREVKLLKDRFLRGKTTPHLGDLDIHVLAGCIKDFLRSLQEPLIPTGMWKDFANAVQNPMDAKVQKDLYKSIEALPQPNRDTLAFLVLHLQRIAECPEIHMPIENLARIFGPTIVGNSSAEPDHHAIYTEVYTQCSVMQALLKLPTEYWTQFVALDLEKENKDATNLVSRTPSRLQKDSVYSLYATPLKYSMKKRKFYTPPVSARK